MPYHHHPYHPPGMDPHMLKWYEQQSNNADHDSEEHEEVEKPVDEDAQALAYAEADYIYNAVSRRLPLPPPPTIQNIAKRQEIEAMIKSRTKQRSKMESGLIRSSSTVVRSNHKTFTNFNSLTRKPEEVSIRLRQRTPPKDDATPPPLPPNCTKLTVSSPDDKIKVSTSSTPEIVTVNGNKNSSIIYLSAETSGQDLGRRSAAKSVRSSNRSISSTIRTGTMTVSVNGTQETPTTIKVQEESDSELSDDQDTADTSDKETSAEDEVHEDRAVHDQKVVKLSKQNADRRKQIVMEACGASSANKPCIDLESTDLDSDYDADLSTLESPKKVKKVEATFADKPKDKKSVIVRNSNLSQESILEEEEDDEVGSLNRIIRRIETSSDNDSVRSATRGEIKSSRASQSKLVQLYQRRKQMQTADITSGFSNDVIKEVYGSKTSLLRQLSNNEEPTPAGERLMFAFD